MLLLLEVGRWIAVRRMAVDPEGAKAGLGAVVGVVFSLLGLLLADRLLVEVRKKMG